jgi:hypothetical protein
MTRRVGAALPSRSRASAEVTVARKQLSTRLLHYPGTAGFNRWYPRMQGKRSYWVLRKFLLQASEEIETRAVLPSACSFPEPFSLERAAEITQSIRGDGHSLVARGRSASQDDDRHRRIERA